MTTCNACGRELREAAAFCGGCGTPVPSHSTSGSIGTRDANAVPEADVVEATVDDEPVSVSSFEESINGWPRLFEDLNDGGDTRKWQKWCVEDWAPAALFEPFVEGPGIVVRGIIRQNEVVRLSFPCFIDDDPVPTRQYQGPGSKVKFHGRARPGLILVTDETFGLVTDDGSVCIPWRVPLSMVYELNELKFKMSMLSMTSAGPGFEMLCRLEDEEEGVEEDRILFRVALTPRRGVDFKKLLRSHISSATGS